MAKTYAQSVKLPNLVAVAHPSTKFLSRDGLNVEGRSSANAGAATSSSNYALNRKDYIKSLMGGDSAKSKAKGRDGILVNTDQIMESIDEKLTTGYHGVKHLFRTNDPSQSGQLSKETFRCILNQLCGYISSEAWNRLIPRFGLDLKDSISFDEFIMHFEDNPKVKKELSATNTSVELVNLAQPTLLMMDMKAKKSQTTPSLSAAYCFALMKAKARSMDFEPREYLPEECFENRGLVMPYHLTDLLNAWDLPLSPNEFQKLWERFDLKNIGGVKTRVFLRLIDYNSNEIEHLTQQTAMLRTKSCIVEKPHQRHASDPSLSQVVKSLSSSVDEKRNEKNAATTFSVDTATNSSSYLKQIIEYDPLESEAVPFDNKFLKKVDQEAEKVLTKEKEAAAAAEAKKKAEAEAQKKRVQSTLSESRIKSMAQFLKNSSKFGPNEDLVVFINNKLNHGYISFKTAFEYIDPDHLGHLLKDEFLIVLREFAINFDHESYDAFLKKHSLIKHNQLVDYQKFLQIFQSLGESSLTMAYLKAKAADAKSATNSQLKQAELNLIEFFHDFYFVLLNFFKEKIGDSSPTSTCTVDFFKRLLEQKLVILMDKSQLDSLLHFINQYDEVQKSNGQVNWMALFKKFAEIDPWQCFKDSCENAMNNLKPFYARRANEPKTGGSPQVVVKSFDTLKPPKRTKSPATPPKPAATVQVDSSAELAALSSSDEDDDDEIKNLDTPRESAAATTTNRLLRSSTIGASSVKMKNTFDTLRLNYLEKSVELLFRTKFHSINKYFTLLDPGHTEKLDKEKFRLLMLKSGLKLNSTDVILLWRDFDAETIPFSNLVRRFFRPDEFNRLRNIKDKIRLDKRIKEYDAADQTQKSRSSVERTSQLFSNLASRSFTAEKTTKPVVQEKKMDIELISKAKPFVLERWSELKRDFQQMDKLSSTHCPNTRAVEIFKKNRINLPEKDLFELCKHFSFNESASDLDYIKFLKYFNASAASYSQTKLNAPKWKNLNPTLRKIILKLRELNSNRTSETNPLVFDLNNLRITFKKFDPVRKGHLTSAEFKDLLKMCSLSVNLDEMYMMFSEYDPDLKGVFNYDLFIKSLIDKSLTSD